MNIDTVYIGIILLFVISIIVRIIPSIIPLNFTEKVTNNIKSLLPTAVFINLVVYCSFQEIDKSPLPFIIAIGIMLLTFRKIGLILSVLIGSSIYLSLNKWQIFLI